MLGSIVPRPIAWVSTISPSGIPNVAPFSYFAAVSGSPPTLCFSSSRRAGVEKDTVVNIRANRQFVVNVVDEATALAMNVTSEDFPPEVDEFAAGNLTVAESNLVAAPHVAEAAIAMECHLNQIVDIGGERPTTALVIGEVVAWHIRDELFDAASGNVDVEKLHAIGRLNGDWYTRTRHLFEMARPRANGRG
jgi:flavin reductase (DIM6/NTAB) family NADH-FMN oxidoreductase RutF